MSAETKDYNLNDVVKALTQENAELRASQELMEQKQKDLKRFYDSELHSLNSRYDVLFQKHLRESKRLQELMVSLEENQHVKAARYELAHERKSLRSLATRLVSEVEYLKKIFPVRSLLSAKNLEIKRMKTSLERLPHGHPERTNIEGFIKGHIQERDQQIKMIELAEQKFDQQIAELEALAGELQNRNQSPAPVDPALGPNLEVDV